MSLKPLKISLWYMAKITTNNEEKNEMKQSKLTQVIDNVSSFRINEAWKIAKYHSDIRTDSHRNFVKWQGELFELSVYLLFNFSEAINPKPAATMAQKRCQIVEIVVLFYFFFFLKIKHTSMNMKTIKFIVMKHSKATSSKVA